MDLRIIYVREQNKNMGHTLAHDRASQGDRETERKSRQRVRGPMTGQRDQEKYTKAPSFVVSGNARLKYVESAKIRSLRMCFLGVFN